ncbi:hypothetical protein SNE40_004109 [Patella caerulea]|uniref:CAP-Gly domain-containing protein n=1 Tax=Patella caerulea TaxID=87958 RepID=A0AAN8Q9E4_PATCE
MSLPRPTGLKAPSKIGRTSGLPQKAAAPGSRPQSPECTSDTHSTDDFKIGDRVWVGGTKPGRIAFIGETKFAPGDWAGIVLDQPTGKNDGSINGIKYFQCEPMKGVFSRVTKLFRQPMSVPPSTPKPGDSAGDSSGMTNGALPMSTPHRPLSRLGTSSKTTSASSSSLNNSISAAVPKATSTPAPGRTAGVKIGDRVLVSGSKTGVLRFVGETEFAKGEWAGVELDEQMGKNDGAVAGKRYFECKPMFGLFAPVHKVMKITANYIPNQMTRSLNTSLRGTRERSGSQDSISSISSSVSSVSRSRNTKAAQRPGAVSVNTSTSALQKALKEKEDHIEQLLRERDLERAEVARAAAQVDDAEIQLTSLRTGQDRYRDEMEEQILKLRAVVQALEKDNNSLKGQLEDEKRKCEDLQFQIEEEVIDKDDLESRTEEESARVEHLEKSFRKEKDKADQYQQELDKLKAALEEKSSKLKEADSTQLTYLDQLEEVTHKLSLAEKKITSYEASKIDDGAKTSQVGMELAEKTSRVSELEEMLANKNREFKQLQDKLDEVLDELKTSNSKNTKMQEAMDEMKAKMESQGSNHNQLSEELKAMRSNHSDVQRQLETSNARSEELAEERKKLENQLADLMKNSGDSSTQLSLLNDELTEKNRRLEEAQNNLSNSSQKISKLNEEITALKEGFEKNKEEIVNKNNLELSTLQGQFEDVQAELTKSKTRIEKLTEDFTKEKEEMISRKDGEISELRNQISNSVEALSQQENKTQAHKQVLDTITQDRDSLNFEKEKLVKNLKRLEGEKEELNKELIHSKVEMTKIAGEQKTMAAEKESMAEQLETLQKSVEKMDKLKAELEKQKDELKKEKDEITTERDQLKQEIIVFKADLQQKDIQIDTLQKEVEKLKVESANQAKILLEKSQTESETSNLATEIDNLQKSLQSVESELKITQAERDEMKSKLQLADLISEQRQKLQEEKTQLQDELQETKARFSEDLSKVETEKTSLQTKIDNSAEQLTQQSKDLDVYKKQISDLQNENSSLSDIQQSLQNSNQQHQQQIDGYLKKIQSLETELKTAQEKTSLVQSVDGSGEVDPAKVKLLEENESAKQQISFLNNLIVNQQGKLHELQVRLEAMESGSYNNGHSDFPPDDSSPSGQKPAPRLFCDICDVFDRHDTDDCPTQAMSESPEPSRHHGDRDLKRPYCETCEDIRHVEGKSDNEDSWHEATGEELFTNTVNGIKGIAETKGRQSPNDEITFQAEKVGWSRALGVDVIHSPTKATELKNSIVPVEPEITALNQGKESIKNNDSQDVPGELLSESITSPESQTPDTRPRRKEEDSKKSNKKPRPKSFPANAQSPDSNSKDKSSIKPRPTSIVAGEKPDQTAKGDNCVIS